MSLIAGDLSSACFVAAAHHLKQQQWWRPQLPHGVQSKGIGCPSWYWGRSNSNSNGERGNGDDRSISIVLQRRRGNGDDDRSQLQWQWGKRTGALGQEQQNSDCNRTVIAVGQRSINRSCFISQSKTSTIVVGESVQTVWFTNIPDVLCCD
jgi:hypothetical protein